MTGAGDGLGGAIARAFAREGLAVCVTRRPRHVEQVEALAQSIRETGGRAFAFGVDARLEAEVVALMDRIEREVGPLEVVVFNIGANVRFGIVETTTQVYSKVWEMAALAGFLTGREAARVMTPRGRGSLLFTGATVRPARGGGCTFRPWLHDGCCVVYVGMVRPVYELEWREGSAVVTSNSGLIFAIARV